MTLCKKGEILFEAGNDVIAHIPDITAEMTSEDIQEIKYRNALSLRHVPKKFLKIIFKKY